MKSMRLRSLLATTLAAGIVVTSTVGCSSGGDSTASNADAGATITEAGTSASGGEDITITMVESLTSADRTAIIREIADKYEADHPNITIDIVSPPLENADNKITQMLMNGTGCDIVETRDLTLTQYVNNGWIAPLDDYLNAWDEKDTLTDAALKAAYGYGDGAYVIPYGFLWRGLYCRSDWFEDAGMELPSTWQEIYDDGVALQNADSNQYGFAFRGSTLGYMYADTVIWSYIGTDVLATTDAGYFLKDGDGATIFTLDETKEALEFYKSLYTDCSPSDSIAWGFAEMVQGFVGGTTAMLIQDPEVISSCQADMEDGTWSLVPFPTGPSGQAVFPNGYSGWSMTSFTEHPDEVADFIFYLSNEENNTYFCKNYATIPIHSNAAEIDSYFSEGPFSIYMDMANDGDTYRTCSAPMMYNAFAAYKAEVDTIYQQWLTDEITTDELMQWLDNYWTQAYADEGQKF